VTKWAYRFDELDLVERQVGGDWEAVREFLGGKGANLAEMTRLGLPVPPGFTITTAACIAYLGGGEAAPEGLWEEVEAALADIERRTGKRFGDPARPLLVSCRSGGKHSMPGMMDTVLNLGLNDRMVTGLAAITGDERFAWDAYRRLVQMFGSVVLGVPDEPFEAVLEDARRRAGVDSDAELSAPSWKAVCAEFRRIVETGAGEPFPEDPGVQVRRAIEAVFRSWNGRRAIDYRNAAGIPHDLGTAVNIVAMVFGNMGADSASGVAMTRDGTTGEPRIEGDYLINAQGEDVVAGIRRTKPIEQLAEEMPEAHARLEELVRRLEKHFRDVQDIEFTIERGELWLLQTRNAKRTAQAAVRIAVDMASEGLVTREEAVLRVSPEQVDYFLHPQLDRASRKAALEGGRLAVGLNVSPGAAVGRVALDPDLAVRWAREEGRPVILVRPETKSDDVHGMLAAKGILTSRGGRTSHAALVARQFGKPAVVGVAELVVDLEERTMRIGSRTIREGEWISIDGTTGEVYGGRLETVIPDIQDPFLLELLKWADVYRRLGVRANADEAVDARRAREYGAEGIGLCRTEHMFFASDRLPVMRRLVLADDPAAREALLVELLPLQRGDFAELFRVMDGLPVVIRLLDPPLHEFLPPYEDLLREVLTLRLGGQDAARLREQEALLWAVERHRESNPMLGLRGVRLGIHMEGLTRMQARAIFEAAGMVQEEGVRAHPEVMIPLVSHVNELKAQREIVDEVAQAVMAESGRSVSYRVGTMIEVPRAALTADRLAEQAAFFSFGTNDLTQMTFAISRDDAEKGFLLEYLSRGLLSENPFVTLDLEGVGDLILIGVERGRNARPDLEIGICGEHGGDPASIEFCHGAGLDYVSCSPYRVPVARLAAAQAALAESDPVRSGRQRGSVSRTS
jgi:pyruvate,orthophosphate dikinase